MNTAQVGMLKKAGTAREALRRKKAEAMARVQRDRQNEAKERRAMAAADAASDAFRTAEKKRRDVEVATAARRDAKARQAERKVAKARQAAAATAAKARGDREKVERGLMAAEDARVLQKQQARAAERQKRREKDTARAEGEARDARLARLIASGASAEALLAACAPEDRARLLAMLAEKSALPGAAVAASLFAGDPRFSGERDDDARRSVECRPGRGGSSTSRPLRREFLCATRTAPR